MATKLSQLEQNVSNWLFEITEKKEGGMIINLNAYCKENNISKGERALIIAYFSKMRDKFNDRQEILESNNILVGNESEKFEQTKQISRNEDPPLFYIIFVNKKWMIPVFEKKFSTLEKSFNKGVSKLLTDLKEMAKYNEYKLETFELPPEEMVEKVNLFQNIIDYCQKTVKVYRNRIDELFVKNAKISRLYNEQLLQPNVEIQNVEIQNVEIQNVEMQKEEVVKECSSCNSNNISELLYTEKGIRCKCNECGDTFVVNQSVRG